MQGKKKGQQEKLLEIFEKEREEICLIKEKVDSLSERQGIKESDVIFLVHESLRYSHVPVEIFSQGLSPLEAVVSHLRNNQGLRFSRIADVLNRDDRTIWTTYENSIRKQKRLFVPSKSKAVIPLKLLGKRKLSILEIIVSYLKEKKEMRLTEIAELLGKNTSTIWTVLNRARRKHSIQDGNKE